MTLSFADFAADYSNITDAVEAAIDAGYSINKASDPTEDAREGLSEEEAIEVAEQDASLLTLTHDASDFVCTDEDGNNTGFRASSLEEAVAMAQADGCEPGENDLPVSFDFVVQRGHPARPGYRVGPKAHLTATIGVDGEVSWT